MNQELLTVLEKIGLKEREIKVYLAVLELSESTVLPISLKAGLKRTYCYDILEDLKKQNLVNYYEKNGRRRYVAEDPTKIKELLRSRLADFDAILPDLRSIYNQSVEKPHVRYYDGKEGIISVYEEVLKAKPKAIDAIASPGEINLHIGDFFLEYVRKIVKSGVRAREIVSKGGELAEYLGLFKKPLQQARILPEATEISTDMMIYDDKMVLISYGQDVHAVVIESRELVRTQRALFEIIWASSKPIK